MPTESYSYSTSPRTPSSGRAELNSSTRLPSSTGALGDSFLRKKVTSSNFLSPNNHNHNQQDQDEDSIQGVTKILPPVPSSAPSAPISTNRRESDVAQSQVSLDLDGITRGEDQKGLRSSSSAASLGMGLLSSTINSVRSLSQGTRWFRGVAGPSEGEREREGEGDSKKRNTLALGEPFDLDDKKSKERINHLSLPHSNRNRNVSTASRFQDAEDDDSQASLSPSGMVGMGGFGFGNQDFSDNDLDGAESIRVIQSGNIILEKVKNQEREKEGESRMNHLNNPFEDSQQIKRSNSTLERKLNVDIGVKRSNSHASNLSSNGGDGLMSNRFLRQSSAKRASFDAREALNRDGDETSFNSIPASRSSTTLGILEGGDVRNKLKVDDAEVGERFGLVSSTSSGAPRNSVAARNNSIGRNSHMGRNNSINQNNSINRNSRFQHQNGNDTPTSQDLGFARRGSVISFDESQSGKSENSLRPGSNSGTGLEDVSMSMKNLNPSTSTHPYQQSSTLLNPNPTSTSLSTSNPNLSQTLLHPSSHFSVSLNASHSSLLSSNSAASTLSELGASLRWSQKFPEGKHMMRAKSRKSLLNLNGELSNSSGFDSNLNGNGRSKSISFSGNVNPSSEKVPMGLNRRSSSRIKLAEMRNGLRFLAKDRFEVLDDGDELNEIGKMGHQEDDGGRRAKWNVFKICLFISVVVVSDKEMVL